VSAERRCFQEGRRLPTVAELQLLRSGPGTQLDEVGEWSNMFITYGQSDSFWGILLYRGDASPLIAPRNTAPFRFRCVAPPRR
jgi:hypothetical protein